MELAIPPVTERLKPRVWTLRLQSVLPLEPGQLGRLLAIAHDEDDEENAHARVICGRETNEQSFEIYSFIGIHSKGGPKEGPYAHCELRISQDSRPTNMKSGADWGALFDGFSREVEEVVWQMSAYWRFPREAAAFGVELPIHLTDLPGFSEIRGIRLVESDTDTDEELYSLILDEYESDRSAQVTMEVELPVDDQLFVTAWEKALSLAGLVVEFNTEESA